MLRVGDIYTMFKNIPCSHFQTENISSITED